MNHDDEIRAFVAIPLPSQVINYLTEMISNLKQVFPEDSMKWVHHANIHLTLQFLGNISKSMMNFLIDKLETDHQFCSFDLTMNKLGAFPSVYKPQVLWVGTTNHQILMDLYKFIQKTTSPLIDDNDNKTFSPHLTIARLRPGVKKEKIECIKQELYKRKDITPISFTITHFCLYQSTLTSKGPIYSELRRYSL